MLDCRLIFNINDFKIEFIGIFERAYIYGSSNACTVRLVTRQVGDRVIPHIFFGEGTPGALEAVHSVARRFLGIDAPQGAPIARGFAVAIDNQNANNQFLAALQQLPMLAPIAKDVAALLRPA